MGTLREDLTGQKFGKLLVICREMTIKNKRQKPYLCQCECGGECLVYSDVLKSYKKTNCGCENFLRSKFECKRNNFIDGQYDNFEILERLDIRGTGRKRYRFYKCKCRHCGKIVERRANHILSKKIKSCGCIIRKLRNLNRKPGEVAFGSLFSTYKSMAKRRNYSFNLSKKQFKKLTKGNCYYCGQQPSQKITNKYNGEYIYNGVDRINNNNGYSIKNCVPCCSICNWMKRNQTYNDFIDKISTIHRNLKLGDMDNAGTLGNCGPTWEECDKYRYII